MCGQFVAAHSPVEFADLFTLDGVMERWLISKRGLFTDCFDLGRQYRDSLLKSAIYFLELMK